MHRLARRMRSCWETQWRGSSEPQTHSPPHLRGACLNNLRDGCSSRCWQPWEKHHVKYLVLGTWLLEKWIWQKKRACNLYKICNSIFTLLAYEIQTWTTAFVFLSTMTGPLELVWSWVSFKILTTAKVSPNTPAKRIAVKMVKMTATLLYIL